MSRRSKKPVPYMTEEEYLKAEEKATVRHEYVNGYVFAMSGSTDAHNLICGNIFYVIYGHLGNSPCRAYINDMKVRIQSATSYYYPDIMVSCEEFEPKSVFKNSPVLLIEVLSPSTAQIDKREKLMAYGKIDTVKEYVIVYQDRQRAELYSKTQVGQWEITEFVGGDDLLLKSLPGELSIPMSTIYKGYNPPTRVKEDESSYYAVTFD